MKYNVAMFDRISVVGVASVSGNLRFVTGLIYT